jgi:hypothetical protein
LTRNGQVFYMVTRRENGKSNMQGNIKHVALGKRIIQYLRAISPRPATPKEIAFELGIEAKTVRATITRLHRHKFIEKSCTGHYRALYTLEDILKTESPELRLHGIKIEGMLPGGAGLTSKLPFMGQPIEQCSGNRKKYSFLYDGRSVTIMVSDNGLIEIFLRSSKHAVDFVTFCGFAGWLDGLFMGQTHALNLNVVELGIGRDFRTYRLDGIKSIKWGQWRNAWAQIYQKQNEMRVEIHLNERIGLGDAIHILRGMTERPGPSKDDIMPEPQPGMYG